MEQEFGIEVNEVVLDQQRGVVVGSVLPVTRFFTYIYCIYVSSGLASPHTASGERWP